VRTVLLSGTTNASGALTVTYGDHVMGKLYAVQLIDGSFDDGVDITLTCEHGDFSIPLLTKADFNSDQMVYPRVATAAIADGAALTDYAMPIVNGKPKMVIAAGGNAKSGGCLLYIED
jgi:hypothetical protein